MIWTWSKKFVAAMVCAGLAFIAFAVYAVFKVDIAALAAFYGFLGVIVKLYQDANIEEHKINGATNGSG